jgi:beta-phosphoglucomutase-like phosphatase (HAD superfamily)
MTVGALGWREAFAAIVTGEDVKEQKPRPEGPLLAAKMLQAAPEHCAFVGDSPADIGAGKAAGMITVMAGWHDVYHDQVRAMQPDIWVETASALIAALSL